MCWDWYLLRTGTRPILYKLSPGQWRIFQRSQKPKIILIFISWMVYTGLADLSKRPDDLVISEPHLDKFYDLIQQRVIWSPLVDVLLEETFYFLSYFLNMIYLFVIFFVQQNNQINQRRQSWSGGKSRITESPPINLSSLYIIWSMDFLNKDSVLSWYMLFSYPNK